MGNIPNQAVKRMLLACVTGSARQEIMQPTGSGLAFENMRQESFSQRCWRNSLKKKTRRGGNRNTQPENREEMKIPGNTAYCTDKLEYGYKHMLQPRGAWESSRMQWSWDCLTWSWREHACSSCLRYCNIVWIICFFK